VNRDILVPGFQHKCTTVQNAWLRSYLHLSGSHARWRAVSLQVITRSAGASIVKAFNIHRRAACTSGCFFLNKKVYKTSSARWCTGMQSCSRVCGRRPESGRDGCCVSQAKSARSPTPRAHAWLCRPWAGSAVHSHSVGWFLSPGLHELALQSPRPKATSPPPPGAFAVDRRRRHEKGFAESTKTVPIPVPATHS